MFDARTNPVLNALSISRQLPGEVWSRLDPAQKNLLQISASLSGGGENQMRLEACASWLAGGEKLVSDVVLGFSLDDVVAVGPERWDWIATSLSDPAVIFSSVDTTPQFEDVTATRDESLVLVSESGCQVFVGGVWALPQEVYYNLQMETETGWEDLLVGGVPLRITTDYYPAAGVPLSAESFWLIPIDPQFQPVAIQGLREVFLEGCHFINYPGLLAFKLPPNEVFEQGAIHCLSARWSPRGIRNHTLKLDHTETPGGYVAFYKRWEQGPRQLEKALAEVAGIPVYEGDGIVTTILPECEQSTVVLDTGAFYKIPSDVLTEQIGDSVAKGEVASEAVRIFCRKIQGDGWYLNRNWTGLPLTGILGGPRNSLLLRDETTLAIVSGEGRLSIALEQNEVEEEEFWDWYHGVGSGALKEGLDISEGETKRVNLFQFLMPVLGDRIMVVQTSLDPLSQEFKAMEDFLERERPVGFFVSLVGIAT